MTPTVGLFIDRASAERAVNNLRAVGLSPTSIHVLVPGSEPRVSKVATGEAERPGMGKAIGGVGAVLLSLGGAVVGGALENALASGLPKDELFVYEDALRRGYAIVVITPADIDEQERSVAVLEGSGAESVDAARERWWIGLRETEAFEYRAEGRDFQRDEPVYREGFEAALSSSMRDRLERDTDAELKSRYPATYREPAFRHGYDRGRAYSRRLLADRRSGPRDGG